MTADAPLRPYRPEDLDACKRIWREIGWNDGSDEQVKAQEAWLASMKSWVAELDGQAECLVSTCDAQMQILDGELPLCIVGAVTTSRVARKIGAARRLTALALAEHVADGTPLAALGMFEQGFYDQLGFGTGVYDHWISCGPRQLLVEGARRPPVRLGLDDWEEMHANRARRRKTHGAVTLARPEGTREAMLMTKAGFGLGFRDDDGALTHHLWASDQGELGPYLVQWMAWQTGEQLRELLGLIRNLGDQVRLVQLPEPAGIQLHAMIDRPVHNRILTRGGKFEQQTKAFAWWQARICDVPATVGALTLPGVDARFNVRLSDPVARWLPDGARWRGVAGDWTIALGPASSAVAGRDEALPTLECGVATLTRLLLGILPASGLVLSDGLQAPPELIAALDRLPIPPPAVDWSF